MTTAGDETRMAARHWISRRGANTLRFSLKNLFLIASIVLAALGGPWIWAVPVLSGFLLLVAEELVADIDVTEDMPPPWYLDAMLRASLPLLIVFTFTVLNVAGPGVGWLDAAFGALGFDMAVARAGPDWVTLGGWIGLDAALSQSIGAGLYVVGGIISLGLFYALAGLNVAHELIHRTHSALDRTIGRWLLAFTLDTAYSIDHIHCHHRMVGTPDDPSTARRGEYIGAFIVRASIGQNLSALRLERERLRRKGTVDRPWTNLYWRGQAMSAVLTAGSALIAGWTGAAVFLIAAALGKAFHTGVTYVEHYGLVRVPGARVEPRHSWSSNRRISLGILYNAPLHAEHHMHATRPFWALHKAGNDTPLLPFGTATSALAALVPPLWQWLITPALKDWDARLASPEERASLKERGLLLG